MLLVHILFWTNKCSKIEVYFVIDLVEIQFQMKCDVSFMCRLNSMNSYSSVVT